MKKYITEKMNNAKYEAIQSAKTTFKYLKEVRNNKLIQAIKEGKSNEQLKQIAIDAIVDEIKFVIVSKGYSGKLENFDVDLFIFKNFRRSLFSISSKDLKVIRAAVKSFNNVQRIRLDEFNFINVEYVQIQEVAVPVEPVAEEPVAEELVVPVIKEPKDEVIPSAIKALPILYNKVVNDNIEEVEYEEIPNTSKRPSDFIKQQSILIPRINFCGGKLF